MKKALLLFMVCFMALAPMMANASVRTDGMGITPVQDEDIDLIWTFPQKIEDYSVVDIRVETLVGTSTDEWGGIIHKDQYLGKWGLYIARPFSGATALNADTRLVTPLTCGIIGGTSNWSQLLTYNPNAIPALVTTNTTAGGANTVDYDPGNALINPSQPENKVDLFKAFAVGNGILGLHLNFANNQDKDDYTNATKEAAEGDADGADANEVTESEDTGHARVIGLNVGYALTDLGPFSAVDFMLGYSMGSVSDENTYTVNEPSTSGLHSTGVLEDDGISEIRVAARLKKEADENTNFLINVGATLGKLALAYTSQVDSDANGVYNNVAGDIDAYTKEYKSTVVKLGVNCNHKVNEGAKVIAGLTASMDKSSWTHTDLSNLANGATDQVANDSGEELTAGGMNVLANVGVEANLFKWLKFRSGMSKNIFMARYVEATEVATANAAGTAYQDTCTVKQTFSGEVATPITLIFGLGMEFKNWTVDLLVTKAAIEDLLRDANLAEGILYSGNVLGSDTGNEIAKADIRYNF